MSDKADAVRKPPVTWDREKMILFIIASELALPSADQFASMSDAQHVEFLEMGFGEERNDLLGALSRLTDEALALRFKIRWEYSEVYRHTRTTILTGDDNKKWAAMPHLEIWEATCLLEGLRPNMQLCEWAVRHAEVDPYAQRIWLIGRDLSRASCGGSLAPKPTPQQALTWAKKRKIPVRSDLAAAIKLIATPTDEDLITKVFRLERDLKSKNAKLASQKQLRCDYLLIIVYLLLKDKGFSPAAETGGTKSPVIGALLNKWESTFRITDKALRAYARSGAELHGKASPLKPRPKSENAA